MTEIRAYREAGSVLVVTLLVSILLIALTVTFSDETGVELSLSGFSRDNDMAHLAARSGVQVALEAIGEDKNKEVDSLMEDWAKAGDLPMPIKLPEETSVSIKIVDENGKLNLNMLVNSQGEPDEERVKQIKRLFRILGLGEEKVDTILDWLDPDDIEGMHGAESGYYKGLQQPYTCPNGMFQTLEQVYLVKGLEEQGQGSNAIKVDTSGTTVDLTPFLTIYTDGKININTAPSEVLQSLSDQVDASVAEAIIDYRQTEEFRQTGELDKVPGLKGEILSGVTSMLTVKSSSMSIESRGSFRDAPCTIRAIIVREGNEAKMRLLYWQVK